MVPTCSNDGAESVLQAEVVTCLLTDFNIGHEAEEGTAPVGSSPGVGVI